MKELYIKERIKVIESELLVSKNRLIKIKEDNSGRTPNVELINEVDLLYKDIYSKKASIDELQNVLNIT